MRKILICGALTVASLGALALTSLGALTVAGLLGSQTVHAQSYYSGAWCAKSNVGGGTQTERCDFATFRACRAYIAGESQAFCVQSQYVTPRSNVIVVPEYRVRQR